MGEQIKMLRTGQIEGFSPGCERGEVYLRRGELPTPYKFPPIQIPPIQILKVRGRVDLYIEKYICPNLWYVKCFC